MVIYDIIPRGIGHLESIYTGKKLCQNYRILDLQGFVLVKSELRQPVDGQSGIFSVFVVMCTKLRLLLC